MGAPAAGGADGAAGAAGAPGAAGAADNDDTAPPNSPAIAASNVGPYASLSCSARTTSLELGHRAALGLKIDRLGVEQGAADRNHDERAAAHASSRVPGRVGEAARCCTPVPPDAILGFVTKGGGVSVHRRDCTNAAELQRQPERLLDVEWAPTAHSTFLVNIQVEAIDRARLLSDITMVLSDAHVNILSATLSTTRDRVAKSRFTFEMAEAKHLDTVLRAVRGVPGVFDVYRVTQ